ncbi:hypothetical protein AB9X87_05365 [Lactiplantibacillus plantarum]|uniref:hypothetical protein n=1 Tax=Lactiplantibacillus plantarum TaxID=1590 RepID=UPI0035236E23
MTTAPAIGEPYRRPIPYGRYRKKTNPYALPAATMRSQIRLQQSAAMITISAD